MELFKKLSKSTQNSRLGNFQHSKKEGSKKRDEEKYLVSKLANIQRSLSSDSKDIDEEEAS